MQATFNSSSLTRLPSGTWRGDGDETVLCSRTPGRGSVYIYIYVFYLYRMVLYMLSILFYKMVLYIYMLSVFVLVVLCSFR